MGPSKRANCLKVPGAGAVHAGMRGMMAAVMVTLIGTGCAAEALDAPRSEDAAEPAPLTAAEPAPCGAVFSPDAVLLDETLDAVARWSDATGCDVRVGEGGIRITLVDVIIIEGEPSGGPGYTRWKDGAWLIEVTDERVPEVIPHEIGHTLNPDIEQPHVVDGVSLMTSAGGAGLITDADLSYVCSLLECTAFVPESYVGGACHEVVGAGSVCRG